MVKICYSYSVEVNGNETEKKTEKVFNSFPNMQEAKTWARNKWKFLRWPDKKATIKHAFIQDDVHYLIEGWQAQKDMERYVSKFEMTMTESWR